MFQERLTICARYGQHLLSSALALAPLWRYPELSHLVRQLANVIASLRRLTWIDSIYWRGDATNNRTLQWVWRWTTYDNVKVLPSEDTREHVCYIIHRRQLFFISKSYLLHILLESGVDWDGNVPQLEGICVKVFQSDLLLVLDGLLQGADRLCRRNPDRENTMRVIAEHETIKFEDRFPVEDVRFRRRRWMVN
jgi:hypothetical protein